jgi:dTDP-glucose 4,6-dehydratase
MTAPFRPKALLVTGGSGFIGSNFIRWLFNKDPDVCIVNCDLLTYAANPRSLDDVQSKHGVSGDGRYRFVRADVRVARDFATALGGTDSNLPGDRSFPPADAVVHLAAETHVDRSITGPTVFVDTNVNGTLTVLEACRAELEARPRDFRLLNVSTDEVYGSLDPSDSPFTEHNPLGPRSPYAASKAAADLFAQAYVKTFHLPVITTRCSNNYGPYQFPEKLIPLMVIRALRNERLPVYGDGLQVRDWILVDDHADALWTVLTRGRQGATYNIGGGNQVTNIDIVKKILGIVERPESLITFVPDRLGHDRRYAMDTSTIKRELGWEPRHPFEQGLQRTVEWYRERSDWWSDLLEEAYRVAETYLR